MTVLWDHSRAHGTTEVVMPGETMVEVFWNGVARRDGALMMREKKFGIWRGWTWRPSMAGSHRQNHR